MDIEYVTKKDLRVFKMSWKEVDEAMQQEDTEGAQVEFFLPKQPVMAFEAGLEFASNAHDISTDTFTNISGFKRKQVIYIRAPRKYVLNAFKEFKREQKKAQKREKEVSAMQVAKKLGFAHIYPRAPRCRKPNCIYCR